MDNKEIQIRKSSGPMMDDLCRVHGINPEIVAKEWAKITKPGKPKEQPPFRVPEKSTSQKQESVPSTAKRGFIDGPEDIDISDLIKKDEISVDQPHARRHNTHYLNTDGKWVEKLDPTYDGLHPGEDPTARPVISVSEETVLRPPEPRKKPKTVIPERTTSPNITPVKDKKTPIFERIGNKIRALREKKEEEVMDPWDDPFNPHNWQQTSELERIDMSYFVEALTVAQNFVSGKRISRENKSRHDFELAWSIKYLKTWMDRTYRDRQNFQQVNNWDEILDGLRFDEVVSFYNKNKKEIERVFKEELTYLREKHGIQRPKPQDLEQAPSGGKEPDIPSGAIGFGEAVGVQTTTPLAVESVAAIPAQQTPDTQQAEELVKKKEEEIDSWGDPFNPDNWQQINELEKDKLKYVALCLTYAKEGHDNNDSREYKSHLGVTPSYLGDVISDLRPEGPNNDLLNKWIREVRNLDSDGNVRFFDKNREEIERVLTEELAYLREKHGIQRPKPQDLEAAPSGGKEPAKELVEENVRPTVESADKTAKPRIELGPFTPDDQQTEAKEEEIDPWDDPFNPDNWREIQIKGYGKNSHLGYGLISTLNNANESHRLFNLANSVQFLSGLVELVRSDSPNGKLLSEWDAFVSKAGYSDRVKFYVENKEEIRRMFAEELAYLRDKHNIQRPKSQDLEPTPSGGREPDAPTGASGFAEAVGTQSATPIIEESVSATPIQETPVTQQAVKQTKKEGEEAIDPLDPDEWEILKEYGTKGQNLVNTLEQLSKGYDNWFRWVPSDVLQIYEQKSENPIIPDLNEYNDQQKKIPDSFIAKLYKLRGDIWGVSGDEAIQFARERREEMMSLLGDALRDLRARYEKSQTN